MSVERNAVRSPRLQVRATEPPGPTSHGGAELARTRAGGWLDAAEPYLSQVASRYPLAAMITAARSSLVPASAGVPGVMGEVLAAVYELSVKDEWQRIKACCNPPCQFAFSDRTRNRAGRFCSSGCSSQVSMRAMRQRRRESAS